MEQDEFLLPKWEYMVFNPRDEYKKAHGEQPSYQQLFDHYLKHELNILGKQGWEICGICGESMNYLEFILKRQCGHRVCGIKQ